MGLYSALFRSFFKLDYRVDLPGLEVKYACEAAEKVGAKIHFMGAELNSDSAKRLAHETRLTLLDYLRQRFMHKNSLWTYERNNNQQKQLLVGPAAYTEKCMDQNQINWYVAATATFFPHFKRIFVDEKDEDIFEQID